MTLGQGRVIVRAFLLVCLQAPVPLPTGSPPRNIRKQVADMMIQGTAKALGRDRDVSARPLAANEYAC